MGSYRMRRRKKRLSAKKKRAIKLRVYFYLTLVAIAGIFAAVIYLSYLPELNVYYVKVIGDKGMAGDVQLFFENKLKNTKNRILSPTNIYLLNKDEMRDEALEQMPKIDSLRVETRYADKYMTVYYSLREAKYLWCEDNFDNNDKQAAPQDCYLADKNGFIFAKAKDKTAGLVELSTALLEDKKRKTPIKQIINHKYLEAADYISKTLNDNGYEFSRIRFTDEGDVFIKLRQFMIKARLDNLQNNLQKFLFIAKTGNIKKDLNNIEYMDLRFKKKIFYKEKNVSISEKKEK